MADEIGLGAFLSDISARDNFLKTAPAPSKEHLPPVRGTPAIEEITAPPPKKAAPKKAAAAAPAAAAPAKDDAEIWDAAEVASLPAARPATAPAAASEAAPLKPRQRKHAYEYFNQWDAYDVEGEIEKLEDA